MVASVSVYIWTVFLCVSHSDVVPDRLHPDVRGIHPWEYISKTFDRNMDLFLHDEGDLSRLRPDPPRLFP